MTKARLAAIFAAATMALAIGSISAKADYVDFACPCTGTLTVSGSNYSSTGIDIFVDHPTSLATKYSIPAADTFALAFNTATGAISIDGNAAGDAGENLSGSITHVSTITGSKTTILVLDAVWSTLPVDFQNALGSPSALDLVSLTYLNNPIRAGSNVHTVTSVDATITPTPEPSSLFLLGSGLVGIGGFLRRKLTRA